MDKYALCVKHMLHELKKLLIIVYIYVYVYKQLLKQKNMRERYDWRMILLLNCALQSHLWLDARPNSIGSRGLFSPWIVNALIEVDLDFLFACSFSFFYRLTWDELWYKILIHRVGDMYFLYINISKKKNYLLHNLTIVANYGSEREDYFK